MPTKDTAQTANLAIGDICVSIESSCPQVLEHVRERYRDFLSSAPPDFRIEMTVLEDADPAEFLGVPRGMLADFVTREARTQVSPCTRTPPAYHRCGVAAGQESGAARPTGKDSFLRSKPKVSHLDHRILFQRTDFAGCMDMKACQGRSIFTENMRSIAIESFLRICYSFLAVEHEGLLLHSAGVMRGQNGYIFPGQSGTGKSTIAGLASDREVILSDEMVVVRKTGEDHVVYSSPFFGTNKSAERSLSASLKAAFLPIKDRDVYVDRAKPARALPKLMAGVLFFGQDPALNRRLMDICNGVVERIPFYDLHFRRDATFWQCIDELENKGGP